MDRRGLVRPAAATDAGAMAALVGALGYPTGSLQMQQRLERLLADPERRATLVLVDDVGLQGLIGLELVPSHTRDGLQGRISVLVVAEPARGRSYGRQLVEAGLSWLATRGARHVVVTTRSDRAEAQAFYRRLGFSRTGYRYALELEGPSE